MSASVPTTCTVIAYQVIEVRLNSPLREPGYRHIACYIILFLRCNLATGLRIVNLIFQVLHKGLHYCTYYFMSPTYINKQLLL